MNNKLPGLLMVAFDYSKAHADEFHDWYDLEHIPEREAVAGFQNCERWLSVDEPGIAIASYELAAVDVLDSPQYQSIAHENLTVWSKRVTSMCQRLTRCEAEQTNPGDSALPRGAGGLLLNAMNVDPEHEAEFNRWYDEEHIPALGAVPGTLSATRYKSRSGDHRYLAVYHLESPDVAKTDAWASAANTEWTAKMRPAFRDRLRILARAYDRDAS